VATYIPFWRICQKGSHPRFRNSSKHPSRSRRRCSLTRRLRGTSVDIKTALARLDEERKEERYVLVVYKQALREGLEAYHVESDLGGRGW